MKYFLSLVVLALLVAAGRAALPPWTIDVVANSALDTALFGSMTLPQGAVVYVRPPAPAKANLTSLIAAKPSPELYGFRAREEERAAEYPAAEADWRRSSLAELADFYERRNEPQKQVETLLRLPAAPAERFQQAVKVAQEALLGPAVQQRIYEAWMGRFPQSAEPYQAYLHWALQNHDQQTAVSVAARLKAAFPQDIPLAVTTDAELAGVRGGSAAMLAVYAQAFSPLWPDGLRTSYFQELTNAHQLRAFLAQAQTAAAADPKSLAPVARLIFYYEGENRKPAADAQLLRFVAHREASKEPWSADELKTIAALFLRLQDYDESARFSFMLPDKETGLANIISLLLDVPEQPLSFANRDLSLYQNIATMDRHPGFLNGILTVALNTTEPDAQYANASQTASSYFHRAAASRLLDQLRADFPQSSRLPELEAELFRTYALYGQDEAILRDVPPWLTRNGNARQYVATALLLADADARTDRVSAELSLYDGLLQTLAAQSGRMPIGRSPDYARVLDRSVGRLVALHRLPDALTLMRREIDHNPDDPGLYERLALFVEQNHLDNDLEQTYSAALAHFKDASWASKLGRLYLRRKRTAAYEALARRVADTFRGTHLATFLNDANPNSPTLYRQINLYAHTRFPHNMQFVTNLLQAYSNKATADYDAYDKLLRENWCNDPRLKTLYFEYLTRDGKLKEILRALPAAPAAATEQNAAALEFRAEAQSWLTDYEAAAPVFVQLASFAPGERVDTERATTIERSLGPLVPGAPALAVQLARQVVAAAPADREALVRTGEILADREQYSQARIWWTRAALLRPGATESYLSGATVFWDYFQFEDALRTIDEGRRRLQDPFLLAYEAGAIDENEGKAKEAITEYTNAWLHESSDIAQRRLLALARRPGTGPLIETQTAALTTGAFDSRSFALRVAVLENQNRRADLQSLLARLAASADTTDETSQVQAVANRLGFDDITAQALARTVAITADPIEKLSARLEVARFYEAHNNAAAAEREYRSLAADEPNRLGILRAAVDYQWRTKQTNQAVQTLVAAADRAQPPYRTQLRREAAEKATTSGQYEEARRLLDELLQDDRYNGDLLAEEASTYARQGDTAGLNKFYAATLANLAQTSLPASEKMARTAALRRGFILALSKAGEFNDALEQYQLILNAYPEDAALAAEASRYAESHRLLPRLVAYYGKATHDSPRDYRWPLVLARIETAAGQLPEAIGSYDQAGMVRPDRSDIPLAKVDLQMRLLRFADAIKTYQKLYELSYHDRQYLASQADAYARLGNSNEALRLWRAAYVEPNPSEPGSYLAVMHQTNTWHLYPASEALFQEARPFLKNKPEWTQQLLSTEMEALTAEHRTGEAVALVKAMAPEPGMRSQLIKSVGEAAGRYLTPAERASLEQQAEQPDWLTGPNAIVFAEAAGLRELQAKGLLAAARAETRGGGSMQALSRLQTSRLLFEDLGQQLESVAPVVKRMPPRYQRIEQEAYQAYAKAGDRSAQERLVNFSGNDFASLFVAESGDLNYRLYELAGQNANRADQVTQHLIATAPADLVRAAIASRGRRISPLWTSGYVALAGLYLDAGAGWVQAAFADALGPRTVGAQLRDRNAKTFLRGPEWFYYAGRYSEFLDNRQKAEAEEYRAQVLEAAPVAANSYRALGDALVEERRWDRAAITYEAALQVDEKRADIYDRLGVLEINRTRREAALQQWRKATELSTARIEEGPLPPEYWPDAQALLTHVNQFGAMPALRTDVDRWLRRYIQRNASYGLLPLLEGLLEKTTERGAAIRWVIELGQLPGAESVLRQLTSAVDVVSSSEKKALFQAQIDAAANAATAAAGEAAVQARNDRREAELEYVRFLAGEEQWAEAWSRLSGLQPPEDRPGDLWLQTGALSGHWNEVLTGYTQRPESVPAAEQILSIAAAVQKLGHPDVALQIEEFEYGRELAAGDAPATAYFGMAHVRFAQKRTPEGLSLIRRVTWCAGAPFENLKTAVNELEAAGLKGEALRFAGEWQKAEPWNQEAQFAAGRLAGDTKTIEAVRLSGVAPYDLRVRAARTLKVLGAIQAGTDELALLTHPSITPAAAAQPFVVEARLEAAAATPTSVDKQKLYREAIALEPRLQKARWLLAELALTDRQDAFGLAVFQSIARDPSEIDANYRRAEQLAAEGFARRENYGQAILLFNQLIGSEGDRAKQAELTKTRDELADRQKLATWNGMRLPQVTRSLTQHRLVRPKLASLPVTERASR